jgi:hypothetical protein
MLEEDEEDDMKVFSSVLFRLVESGDGCCCCAANGIGLSTIGSPTTTNTRCRLRVNSTTALSQGSQIKGPTASLHTSVIYRHQLDKNVLNVVIIRDQRRPPLLPPQLMSPFVMVMSFLRE